jgi:hypothetical protein
MPAENITHPYIGAWSAVEWEWQALVQNTHCISNRNGQMSCMLPVRRSERIGGHIPKMLTLVARDDLLAH